MNRFFILTLAGLCLATVLTAGCGGNGVTPQDNVEIIISQPMAGDIFNRSQVEYLTVLGAELISGQLVEDGNVQIFLWHFTPAGTEVVQLTTDVPIYPTGAFTLDVPMPPTAGTYAVVVIDSSPSKWAMGTSGRFSVI